MASNNETVADIVREMFEYPKSWGEYNHLDWKALAKRIQEAHDHELDVQVGSISRLIDKHAVKDDERLTIVANYETVIAAKDAEIAELRDKIKVAEDALKNSPCGVIYQLGISDDDGNFYDGVVIKFDEAEVLKMPRVRQGDKFRVLPLNALAAI